MILLLSPSFYHTLTVSDKRYKWHTRGCQFALVVVPTYLTTIFFGLLAAAFAALLLTAAALILDFVLDIYHEVKIAHLLLEIAHNGALCGTVIYLCYVIYHLQSIYAAER